MSSRSLCVLRCGTTRLEYSWNARLFLGGRPTYNVQKKRKRNEYPEAKFYASRNRAGDAPLSSDREMDSYTNSASRTLHILLPADCLRQRNRPKPIACTRQGHQVDDAINCTHRTLLQKYFTLVRTRLELYGWLCVQMLCHMQTSCRRRTSGFLSSLIAGSVCALNRRWRAATDLLQYPRKGKRCAPHTLIPTGMLRVPVYLQITRCSRRHLKIPTSAREKETCI